MKDKKSSKLYYLCSSFLSYDKFIIHIYIIFDESLCMPRRKKKENGGLKARDIESFREKIPKYTTRFYGWTGMSDESDSTISLKTDDIDWTRVAIAPRERNMRWFTRPRKIEPGSDVTLHFDISILRCAFPFAPLCWNSSSLLPVHGRIIVLLRVG